ncbi:MAG: GDP-mannose 4,6-dehydratase [Nanoarchaeota archaeon]
MTTLRNKSVLVTGGAGFIGSHLIEEIIKERPRHIVVVDNFFLGDMKNLSDAKKKFNSLTVKNQDASDYKKMKLIIKENEIDAVFNLAMVPLPVSLVKPEWSFDINVKITRALCQLLREDTFKTLCHYSSSEVYGTALKDKMDEQHPLFPHTPYAASKAACDHLVYSYYKTFGIDMLIVRPFNNFGPRQNDMSYAGVIPITIKRIMNNQTPVIYGDGMQTRDFLFVRDTAKATVTAYKSSNTHGKIINVASGKETSVNTLVKIICNELSWTKPVKYEGARPGDVKRHLGDITLAKKLINFKPSVNLEDGIKETVMWYKKKYNESK